VTYLLDTSVWLRGTVEPQTLPAELQAILGHPSEVFGLSPISLWEVGKKVQIGKL
jgi:PIN domain nuclease of toxin-antitoxin system